MCVSNHDILHHSSLQQLGKIEALSVNVTAVNRELNSVSSQVQDILVLLEIGRQICVKVKEKGTPAL